MRRAICGLLILGGCGSDVCRDADFEADGLCVFTNGFDAEPEAVGSTLVTVEKAAASIHDGVELRSGLEHYPLPVFLVSSEDENLTLSTHGRAAGTTYFNQIDGSFVMYVMAEDSCLMHLILAHELLHVVEIAFLHATANQSTEHQYPRMFVEWALAHDLPFSTTAEGLARQSLFGTACP